MAGIEAETPIGPDWEYSLDGITWQASTVFNAQPSGEPFVKGDFYEVICRNQAQNITCQDVVIFGEESSDPTLVNLVYRASEAARKAFKRLLFGTDKLDLQATTSQGAQTDVLSSFNGGVIVELPDLPAGLDSADVVVGEDRQLYAKRPVVVPVPDLPYTRGRVRYLTKVAVPVTLKSLLILGDLSMNVGQTIVEQVWAFFSDDSRKDITGLATKTTNDSSTSWATDGTFSAPTGDTRGVMLTATSLGKTATKTINLFHTNQIVPTGEYRIVVAGPLPEGGASVAFDLQEKLTDGNWRPYSGGAIDWHFSTSLTGLTIAGSSASVLGQAALGSVTSDTVVPLHAVIGGNPVSYAKTIESENAAGSGAIFPKGEASGGNMKEGELSYTLTDVPGPGTYTIILSYFSIGNAPTATISVNGATAVPLQLLASDGVLKTAQLSLYLPGGDPILKITPVGYFASDKISVSGTSSGVAIDVEAPVTILNAAPPPATFQRYEIRPSGKLVEGSTISLQVAKIFSDGSVVNLAGAGSYALIAPYPDGMSVGSAVNGLATASLPANSITGDLGISVQFTVTDGNVVVSGTIELQNVAAPKLTSITISGPDKVFDQSSTQYQATGHYTNGTTADITTTAAWGVGPATNLAGQSIAGSVVGTAGGLLQIYMGNANFTPELDELRAELIVDGVAVMGKKIVRVEKYDN